MGTARAGVTVTEHPPSDVRPYWAPSVLGFLADRAVDGVEHAAAGTYRRVLPASLGEGTLRVSAHETGPAAVTIAVTTALRHPADHAVAYGAVCRLLDLGTDGEAVDAVLGADPHLGPLVRRRPGLRVPGAVDPHEIVVRAIVGQQVSVSAARTVLSGLARRHGAEIAPLDGDGDGEGAGDGDGDGVRTGDVHGDDAMLVRRFPAAEALARLDPAALPMPRARGTCLVGACRALVEGAVRFVDDGGAELEPAELRASLLALRGIGPWTADYIVLRTTADRDVFLAGDLAVRRAAGRLGMVSDAAALAAFAERWRPWRSYATMHLWASLADDAS